ncbi:MAG: CBS domain-containing protein [Bdellovibrionota bacterium]
MKNMPKIEKYMTPMPHTVNKDLTIKQALSFMRQHRIRHLPVESGGRLVGILSDRDIHLATTFEESGELRVEDAMTPDPFTVTPQATLYEVCITMAEHKYGCTVIQQENGKVVGIFTANDGLRVLAEVLTKNYL